MVSLMEKQPCIIGRLGGGLGNQLFMYAFAKAMATRNRVPLKLDTESGFVRDKTYKSRFLLDQILPAEQHANRWESRLFPLGHTLRKIDRKVNALLPLDRRYYVQERTLRFDPDIFNLKVVRPTVFTGYWQSPLYFGDLQPDMASLLRFPDALVAPLAEEARAIQAAGANAVCLAIRRFEEVPNPKHHILQLDYFESAMARIEQRVETPHYFVFARTMDWAREHIRSHHPVTYAQDKGMYAGAIQDLYLMTRCRHYIISNSTLYWWAAWLGTAADKLVVAPAKGWGSSDILPANWVTLS